MKVGLALDFRRTKQQLVETAILLTGPIGSGLGSIGQ
jgi:hypothetical protein